MAGWFHQPEMGQSHLWFGWQKALANEISYFLIIWFFLLVSACPPSVSIGVYCWLSSQHRAWCRFWVIPSDQTPDCATLDTVPLDVWDLSSSWLLTKLCHFAPPPLKGERRRGKKMAELRWKKNNIIKLHFGGLRVSEVQSFNARCATWLESRCPWANLCKAGRSAGSFSSGTKSGGTFVILVGMLSVNSN